MGKNELLQQLPYPYIAGSISSNVVYTWYEHDLLKLRSFRLVEWLPDGVLT